MRGVSVACCDLAHEPVLVELEQQRFQLVDFYLVELDLQVGEGRLAVDLREHGTIRARQEAGLAARLLHSLARLRVDRGRIHWALAEFLL
jgi:hypothetical protein